MGPNEGRKAFTLETLAPSLVALGADQPEKVLYAERPDPTFMTYGPQTRREFFALLKAGG